MGGKQREREQEWGIEKKDFFSSAAEVPAAQAGGEIQGCVTRLECDELRRMGWVTLTDYADLRLTGIPTT